MLRIPDRTIILASNSTARHDMLEKAGLQFEAEPANIDEESIITAAHAEGASARDTATLLAELKATKISTQYPDAYIIGADQLLDLEGEWLSKPQTETRASEQLQNLAGKTHALVTAAVVIAGGRRLWHHVETPRISIRSLSSQEIKNYLKMMGRKGQDIFATPGVYMIESLGAQIISKIDGCPYAVLGMPLLQLLDFLRQHGLTFTDEEAG